MSSSPVDAAVDRADSPVVRKARGAFFTPETITRHLARWAVQDAGDRVLEPSAGDAAFLVEVVRRLSALGAADPVVDGVEIHAASAAVAEARVLASGGTATVWVADFFAVPPVPRYDAVIGNPPFIRYQGFTGESRMLARQAALRAGVTLTALASSWAAFTVHSALFLRPGGRLGLVLPSELLSVNYAAAVRSFLLASFRSVRLVLFAEQVFSEVEADTLLLLADGYGEGPTDHATITQVRSAATLDDGGADSTWTPDDPAAKWTGMLAPRGATDALRRATDDEVVGPLEAWGATTLGMVTGGNSFFTLSRARVFELGLGDADLLPLSPPGSTHLRAGLDLTPERLAALGANGRATALFAPAAPLSAAASRHVAAGHQAGVDQAYKCRVRRPWYAVPLLPPADLLLTCMNADTPRLVGNSARARHLNSVHGVYLTPALQDLGRELLPLASLNSLSLFSAEVVGRSYGGGILKLEPREADLWAVPTPAAVERAADGLRRVRPRVEAALAGGRLLDAVAVVDDVLQTTSAGVSPEDVEAIRQGRTSMSARRTTRGRRGR